MRIEYKIPGWEPQPRQSASEIGASPSPFRTRMSELNAVIPKDWRELLRLNVAPRPQLEIGPPQKPASLRGKDEGEIRSIWYGMLARQKKAYSQRFLEMTPDDQRTRAMLEILLQQQQMEERAKTKSIAASEG